MRTPSPSWCGLDRTHLWPTGSSLGDPIDYGPELLLMPFGFHLAMDTLPSGDRKWWLQVRLGCIRLSSSCPFRRLHTFHFSGQRGFQPRFWIQCSSSEHRRDFNPPDQRAAQRTSGRRRRAYALASVRRSNCTCRFPAYSFHEDTREREAEPSEGIREMRFTKPNSSYSFTRGNCSQPRVRHRRKRCDQMRRTIQPSSLWKSVRTWARLQVGRAAC